LIDRLLNFYAAGLVYIPVDASTFSVGIFMLFGVFTFASIVTHLMTIETISSSNNLLTYLIKAITLSLSLLLALFFLRLKKRRTFHPTATNKITAKIPLIPVSHPLNQSQINAPKVAPLDPSTFYKLKEELEQRLNEQTTALQRNNEQLKHEIEGSEKKSEELYLLRLLTQSISEAPDFYSALSITLRSVCELTNWEYGEAWLPREEILECSPAWYGNTETEKFRRESEKLTFPPNIGLPGRVWTSQQPEWIEDISTQTGGFVVRKQAHDAGIKAGFAVPILIGESVASQEPLSYSSSGFLLQASPDCLNPTMPSELILSEQSEQSQQVALENKNITQHSKNRVLAILTFFFTQSRATDKRWVELVTAVAMQLGLIIQRKQLEEQLRQERDFSKTLIETSPAFFVALDTEGKTIMMNQGCLNALEYSLDEVVGTDYRSKFIPEAEQESLKVILEQLVKLKKPTITQNHVIAKDGRNLLVEWRHRAIFNKTEELDFLFSVGIDITQRRLSEKESARLASIALLSPNPIVETDLKGKVCYLNPEAMRLFPELQDMGEKHPFLNRVPAMVAALQRKGSLRREVKIGEVYYEQVLHYVSEVECLRIYAFDITERKLAEEQLIHNAFYDQLTGLSNRALFMDRLHQAFRRAKLNRKNNSRSQPYQFALLFLNLNRFKLVNDSLGNRIGDQLLQCFARRLQSCLRPTDTVARLGGDEFALLIEGIQDVNDATRLADEINETLSSPFYLDGCEVFMTLSIGIALNTRHLNRKNGQDSNLQPEDLLRDADAAMHSAKAKGKACYEVFDAIMHGQSIDRLQMETDLRRAIIRQEFQVYYQPIVSLYTGRIIGFEALIRWQHPQRGLVSPTEFIPTAEETGLITPIGWWTLWEACHQLRTWQEQFPGSKPLTMNVNLSCKQFTQPNLLDQIDEVLIKTGIALGSLKLEITESVVMDNPDLVKEILLDLKKRKIHLCIDDFGTGYSSLSRLHHFPISTLKIDRSFVSRIGALGENSEIVQAIVTLAQTLSMDVVAEGIEVSEQVSPLIALQCEYGQGYFFSKPVDSEAAGALLMTEWKQRGRS
jgi:diguanylate cyclase (GGDEF)-like protein/PAS domain S-box-containing protein